MPLPALTIFRDRLIAADPGFARLLLAIRVTLAVGLSVVTVAIAAVAFDFPATVAILGAIVAMQGVLAVNDAHPRTTTLLTPLPGIAAIVLGALVADRGILADIVFLAVLFVAVAIRARGPRWTAFGTIAVVTYFFALFFGATIGQLPELVAAVLIAIGFAYAARFVLVPDRPAWIARHTIFAFEARIRTVSAAAARLIDARDPASARRRLATATQQLNETAAAIEARLGEGSTHEIRVIFDAELAAEDLARAAAALRDAAVPLPRALRLALIALTRGRAARAARVATRAAHDPRTHAAAHALAVAIVDLGETIGRVDSATATLGRSDGPWSGGGPQQPVLRQAIQVTAASAVAIVVGEALSPQRWYWAVLATYFVFIGTASSGETFARAWSRITGTALGVAAGVVVGHFAAGHRRLDIIAIFACLFMAVYLLRISQMLMIFFITALLALLYTLLGRFSDGLLAIRLIETAIGAICGGVAATFLFPTRTRDVVRASASAALGATQAAIHASVQRIIDPHATTAPLDAARVLEENVQHFVARAKPATATPTLIGTGHELRRWITSLNACSYYARMLARTADRSTSPINGSTAARLVQLEALISANIDAAARRVDGQHDTPTVSTLALLDTLRRDAQAARGTAAPLESATQLLERLDRTVARLARDEGTVIEIG